MTRNITRYMFARISLFLAFSLLQGCYSIPGNEINESELQPNKNISSPIFVEFRASDPETFHSVKLKEKIERRLVQYGFTLDENGESPSPCKVLISYESKSGSNLITNLGEVLSALTLFILPSYTPHDHIITYQIKSRKTNTLLRQYSVRETADRGASILLADRYNWARADQEAFRKLQKATVSLLTNDKLLKECYANPEIQ